MWCYSYPTTPARPRYVQQYAVRTHVRARAAVPPVGGQIYIVLPGRGRWGMGAWTVVADGSHELEGYQDRTVTRRARSTAPVDRRSEVQRTAQINRSRALLLLLRTVPRRALERAPVVVLRWGRWYTFRFALFQLAGCAARLHADELLRTLRFGRLRCRRPWYVHDASELVVYLLTSGFAHRSASSVSQSKDGDVERNRVDPMDEVRSSI